MVLSNITLNTVLHPTTLYSSVNIGWSVGMHPENIFNFLRRWKVISCILRALVFSAVVPPEILVLNSAIPQDSRDQVTKFYHF